MELSSLESELLMLKREREGGRRQADVVEVIRLCPPHELNSKANQRGGSTIYESHHLGGGIWNPSLSFNGEYAQSAA